MKGKVRIDHGPAGKRLIGNAVAASKVATIRQGQAKVINRSSAAVNHGSSPQRRKDVVKCLGLAQLGL
jgi:hypothetical protein